MEGLGAFQFKVHHRTLAIGNCVSMKDLSSATRLPSIPLQKYAHLQVVTLGEAGVQRISPTSSGRVTFSPVLYAYAPPCCMNTPSGQTRQYARHLG